MDVTNRPTRYNALSLAFFSEFPRALSSLDQNLEVSVIILSSRGKQFYTGIDLATLNSLSSDVPFDRGHSGEKLNINKARWEYSTRRAGRCGKAMRNLHRSSWDHEAEVFKVSNDDTVVAQRQLEDKPPEEKTNTDCLVKEKEKEYQTGWKIKTAPGDLEQHLACELFGYREDSNDATFEVAIVEKIYAHESLTFNDTVAYEVISKWKAGLKDYMDAQSDVYVLNHGSIRSEYTRLDIASHLQLVRFYDYKDVHEAEEAMMLLDMMSQEVWLSLVARIATGALGKRRTRVWGFQHRGKEFCTGIDLATLNSLSSDVPSDRGRSGEK
ncbi:zinc finger, CCHC-type containing protein [Tanacetum coccineum]